jgi:hypothetical protein
MGKIINAQAFEAFVVKAFKLTPEEVASLYNEAGELTNFSLIETKDSERVKKFNKTTTDQYGAGFKKGAASIEDAIKEKYAVDSELLGVELFDHIVETKIAEVKGAAPEDVMKHPDVIKLINQHARDKKTWDKEWQLKLDAKAEEINQTNLFKEVEDAALVDFDSFGVILPEDPKKAKALKDVYIAEVKKRKHQKEKDGFSILGEDGKTVLTDEHGYPVSFTDSNRSIAERYFDFKVAEERSSAGLTEEQKKKQQSVKVRKPKDKDDYVSMMQDQTLTSKERIEIKNLAVAAKIV